MDEHVLYSQLGASLVPATVFVYTGNLAVYERSDSTRAAHAALTA